MKISISGIYDRGNLNLERVHFRADVNIDLSFFVLFDTYYSLGTQVSAGNHLSYWFGPRSIARGEHVVVYTRAGNPSKEARKDGSIYHFLFRGLQAPQYTQVNACAAIMDLQTWAVTQPNPAPLAPLPPDNSLSGLLGLGSRLAAPSTGATLGALSGLASGSTPATLADALKRSS